MRDVKIEADSRIEKLYNAVLDAYQKKSEAEARDVARRIEKLAALTQTDAQTEPPRESLTSLARFVLMGETSKPAPSRAVKGDRVVVRDGVLEIDAFIAPSFQQLAEMYAKGQQRFFPMLTLSVGEYVEVFSWLTLCECVSLNGDKSVYVETNSGAVVGVDIASLLDDFARADPASIKANIEIAKGLRRHAQFVTARNFWAQIFPDLTNEPERTPTRRAEERPSVYRI